MTTFAHSTLAWNSNLFSPGVTEDVTPRPASHRFDQIDDARRAIPTAATPPGSEPDRSEEEDERWDGLKLESEKLP